MPFYYHGICVFPQKALSIKAHKFLTAFLIYHFPQMNDGESDAERSEERNVVLNRGNRKINNQKIRFGSTNPFGF